MKTTEESMKALELIEQAMTKSAAPYGELRKQADDAFDARVAEIAKEHKCTLAKAHALAASDDIASRAYSLSVDAGEKQAFQLRAGGQMAAYLE